SISRSRIWKATYATARRCPNRASWSRDAKRTMKPSLVRLCHTASFPAVRYPSTGSHATIRRRPARTACCVACRAPPGGRGGRQHRGGRAAGADGGRCSLMAALIRKALSSRPARFWLTAGGIGVAALLVLVLGAAYRSVSSSVAAYVGQPGIDVWVAPGGVD